MDVEHLDVVLGAKLAPLQAGMAQADALVARQEANFKRLGATAAAAGDQAAAGWAKATVQLSKMEPALRTVGSSLTRYVTVPTLAVGAAAVKMGMDFQRNMALIQSSAGASSAEVARMTKPVLDLARATQYGPNQLAEALYHIESLGYRGEKAMSILKVATVGATAGQADLEATASALGGAVRTNIKGATDYAQAMGVLNGIVGAGNMRMDDLIAALGTGVLPAAKAAGLGIVDVGAALATMTDENMSSQRAATRLRMAFSLLGAASGPARKALAEIGLTTEDLGVAMHGPNGLSAAITLLKQHLDQLGGGEVISHLSQQLKDGQISIEKFQEAAAKTAQFQVLSRAFGGGRTAAAIMLLVNNLGVLNLKYRQIEGTASDLNARALAQQQTELYKLHKAWATVQVDLVKIGSDAAPGVVKLADAVGQIADTFEALPGPVRSAVERILVLLAVGGPLMVALAAIIKATRTVAETFAVVGPAAEKAAAQTVAASTTADAALTTWTARAGSVSTATVGIGTSATKAAATTTAAAAEADAALTGIGAAAATAAGAGGVGLLSKSLGGLAKFGPLLGMLAKLAGYTFGGVPNETHGAQLNQFLVAASSQIVGGKGKVGNEWLDLATGKRVAAPSQAQIRAANAAFMGGNALVNPLASLAGTQLAGDNLKAYIAAAAKKAGLDPQAVLAVASAEGGFSGAVGDNGTSFGPFQLHVGGALPKGLSGAAGAAFANSPAGIKYAIAQMAKVAGGLSGMSAVSAIVKRFERPADGGVGDISRATAFLMGGGYTPSEADIQKGGAGGAAAQPYTLQTQLALAQLTPGSGDDLAILRKMQTQEQSALAAAEKAHATQKKIQTLAGTLADTRSQIAAILAGKKTGGSSASKTLDQFLPKSVQMELAVAGRPAPLFTAEGPQYYQAAYAHNAPFAKPSATNYQTKLTAKQETLFRAWVKKNNVPFDPDAKNVDYDMRGYWLAMRAGEIAKWAGGNAHFPDTFKTPYDTTFSAESKYATANNPFKWQGNNLVDTRTQTLVFGKVISQRKAYSDELVAINKALGKKLTADERLQLEQEKTTVLGELDQLGKSELSARKTAAAKVTAALTQAAAAAAAVEKAANDKIIAAQKTMLDQAQAAVDASKSAFETAWGRVGDAAMAAYDRVTQQHLSEMQAQVAQHLQQMQITVAGFGFRYGGSITQTPAEQALAALQDRQQQIQDTRDMADAQQQLADAQQQLAQANQGQSLGMVYDAATGSYTQKYGAVDQSAVKSAQQAVLDAQRQIDDLKVQEQEEALQKQADAEKTAAQQQLQDAQNAYQAQADAEQQAYQDQRTLQETALQQQTQAIETAMEDGTTSTADGLAQIKKLWGDAGVPLASLAFVVGGQIYTGLEAGLKPVWALLQKLVDDTKAAAEYAANAGKGMAAPNLNPLPGGGVSGPTLQAVHSLALSGAIDQQTAAYLTRGLRAMGVPGFASGGSFVTNGPTPIVTGEGGERELVQVTPLSRLRRAGQRAGGDGMVVQLSVSCLDPAQVDWDDVGRRAANGVRRELLRLGKRNTTLGFT